MAIPLATWVFGGLGSLLLLRGVWNPHRDVVREGSLASCPGPDNGRCQDTIALNVPAGTDVYSTGSGTVVAAGDRFVHVQLSNEPVVIHYFGLAPDVTPGQHVGNGRRLGKALGDAPVEFGVTGIIKDNGPPALVSVEPRSWLAARGYGLSVKKLPETDAWCGAGRHITVPKAVHQAPPQGCGLRNPQKAGFALLPVSVTQE